MLAQTLNGITVAGGNGPGVALNQLSYPQGIFVDNSGNLFIADYINNRIQKWSQGAVNGVTVAGGNGMGSAINQLCRPTDVFVNANGSIFITDTYNVNGPFNFRVQKWNQGAVYGITVMGGNGYGSSFNQLSVPTGIHGDNNGNIFVADSQNSRVQKLPAATGVPITVAGANGYGSSNNKLYQNQGVFVDNSGNLYIADTGNNRIQKWAPGATSGITVAGGNGRGSALNQLDFPQNLSVDSNGNLFIADGGNNRIQKWVTGATEGMTIIGGGVSGSNANQLDFPNDIYLFENNIYVSDVGNQRIQKYPNIEMPPCITPTGMQWKNKTSTSFQPSWDGVNGYSYVIRYRAVGTNTWRTTSRIPCVTSGIQQTTISNLLNETNYEWQIRAICSVGFESQYSISTFTTTSCQPPVFLPIATNDISNNSCTLNWNSFGVRVIFFVRWREIGTSAWYTTNNVYDNTYTITGLLPNSDYEAQINMDCEIDGVISPYSPSTTFTTSPNCVVATATLSGDTTIFKGQSANLSVALTGSSPWLIIVDDVTYNPSFSPYVIAVTPLATKTYSITSVNNSCDAGTVSGSAVVTVNACTNMYSILSGNWNINNTWSCNRQPTITDNITISTGHTVTIPSGATGFLNGLTLNGVFINNGRLKYKEL